MPKLAVSLSCRINKDVVCTVFYFSMQCVEDKTRTVSVVYIKQACSV